MEKHADFDFLLKTLLIGDSGSGKTCILGRYINEDFNESYISTIGVDFKIKRIELDDQIIQLQIFDTAGQERFRSIISSYYRSSNGIAIVFDITKRESFESVPYWMSQADQLADPQTMKFLVGNKADLAGQRAISEDECQSAATQFDCQYFETSALTDLNIEKLFTEIARATVKMAEHFQHNAGNVKSKNQKNENNDSCC